MTFEAWLLFCTTETLLCLTPGPAVMLVVSLAMTRGAGAGTRAALGILAANALYFALSATGIGALLQTSWQLFFALKWLGAAYLVWLGLGLLRGSHGEATAVAPRREGLRHGLLTQAANPKSLVFFSAILPQFVAPDAPLLPQLALLGLSSIAIEALVLVVYARLAARGSRALGGARARAWLGRAGGVLLWAAAARLLGLRRGGVAGLLP